MTLNDNDRIHITRTFRQAPERVFAAFSTARAVAAWLSPAPDIAIHVEQFEFWVEGRYRFAYSLPDGAIARLGGCFLRIDPPRTLSFSWTWEAPDPHAGQDTLVRIELEPVVPAGTQLSLLHDRLAAPGMCARHQQGWDGTLNRLSVFLTTIGTETELS